MTATSNPRLSIATICFNNLAELQTTCAKLDEQTMLPYEHWIIDGSKNTEILDWLQSTPQPAYRRWLHERDRGISDAFNKGVTHSTGDFVHLHNSGDYYHDPNVLADVHAALAANPNATWLHGNYVQFRAGIWVESGGKFDASKLYRGFRQVGHPTMFVAKALYNQYGLFDENKKIAMDYDFLVRIRKEHFIYLPRPIVVFTPGGVSEQKVMPGWLEVKASYEKYIGKDYRLAIRGLRMKLLAGLYRSPVGKKLFALKNKKKGRTID